MNYVKEKRIVNMLEHLDEDTFVSVYNDSVNEKYQIDVEDEHYDPDRLYYPDMLDKILEHWETTNPNYPLTEDDFFQYLIDNHYADYEFIYHSDQSLLEDIYSDFI